jgi:hypothetical protein
MVVDGMCLGCGALGRGGSEQDAIQRIDNGIKRGTTGVSIDFLVRYNIRL